MKIKKEFEIKILDSSLDVYRLGNTKDLLHITDAQYKEKGKYVELNLKYPKNNISLLRSKLLNTDKITLASKGYKSSSNYFYMSLDKENSVVTLRKINTFYLFQNKFDYLEIKVDKQKEGIQFRKIESREEIEHRKNNINYKIKTLENEDFKSLKYVDTSNDIIDQLSSLQIDDNIAKIPPLIGSISKKIMNSLKKVVVVNIKDLELLYKDKDVIRSVISKNAFYFNGRYILNDSFYSDDLQQTRKKILEIIHKKGYILTTDIKQDLHLIYELCNKDNTSPKYYLKGYYEEEDINIVNKAVAADSIIYNIIKERYFCTLADITNNCSLEIERIKNVLFKEAFISVGENIYTIADPDDPYNELKQEIIRLVQNKKSYRKGEMNVAISNISEALSIETDVVLKHIEKVYINKKGIWTIKESFN